MVVAEAVVVAIHSILVMFGLSIYTLDDANLAFQEHYRTGARTSGRSLPHSSTAYLLLSSARTGGAIEWSSKQSNNAYTTLRRASRLATRLLALHPAPPPRRHFRFCFLSSQNARLPSVDARLDVLEQGRVEDALGVHLLDEGVGLLDELQARRLHLGRRVGHGGDAGARGRRVAVHEDVLAPQVPLFQNVVQGLLHVGGQLIPRAVDGVPDLALPRSVEGLVECACITFLLVVIYRFY